MKVRFLEPAYEEYREAIEFYNLQKSGLGDKFIGEIDSTISIIKNYPDSFPSYTQHTKKALVNTSPYNIIYLIQNKEIVIFAVAHQHRIPNYWVNR